MFDSTAIGEIKEVLCGMVLQDLVGIMVDYHIDVYEGSDWRAGDPRHRGYRTMHGGMESVRKLTRKMVASGLSAGRAESEVKRLLAGEIIDCIMTTSIADEPDNGFWVDLEGVHKVWLDH